MKKTGFYLFFTAIIFTSCATEKFNVSPLSNSLATANAKTGSLEDVMGGTMKNNVNAAEITNLIATVPQFQNEAVNKEVTKLKANLQNYLYAFEAYNIKGKHRYLKSVQNSYKSIQKLRNKLTPDEDDIINRYLVKIKTNLSVLESSGNITP